MMNRKMFRTALVQVKKTVNAHGFQAAVRAANRIGIPEAAKYEEFTPCSWIPSRLNVRLVLARRT